MALNLLGKDNKEEVPESKRVIEMYIPGAEKKAEKKVEDGAGKKKAEMEAETKSQIAAEALRVPQLDLASKYLRRAKIIRGGIIAGILVIVIASGSYLAYYLVSRPVGIVKEAPVNIENSPVTPPTVTEPRELPTVTPPAPSVPSQPPLLPDTDLAPLRGALVRFLGSSELFLIELNGELRPVDISNTRFANGLTVLQTSPELIYRISDKWRTIRRGRAVTGQVDFDPRVLSQLELLPYSQ